MKFKVFLDDIRSPYMSHNSNKGLGIDYSKSNDWVIIRDYFSFIDFIDKEFNNIELISFDHDLACYKNDREYTGKDAMNYIIDYCMDNNKKVPDWYVHSDNTVGRSNIIGLVLSYMSKYNNLNIEYFRNYHRGFVNGKFI
jgi:hypothetical protein